MNLNQIEIKYILDAVKTAKLVGIENIIIEPNAVRGVDETSSVVLLQTENVPAMSFQSIGLTRIDAFVSRYEIVRTLDNFAIEAIMDDGDTYVKNLKMKGKKVKIEYRCSDPERIRAPQKLNGDYVASIELTGEAVHLLHKGQAAMSTDIVTVLCNQDGEVSFEMVDINNDVFKHVLANKVDILNGEDSLSFAYRYPLKTILALFKQDSAATMCITERGILQFPVNGMNIHLLPKV